MRRAFAIAALAACVAACSRAPVPASVDDDAQPPASIAAPSSVATAPTQSEPRIVDARELLHVFQGGDSFDSLRDRFGPGNVQAQDIAGAEGQMVRGVVLFPDDPTRRATLYFADPDKLQGLQVVRITDPESTWSIDHDIRMGTTLAELVARNGGPIQFSGFGWDYGGAVAGFGGGKLEPGSAAGPQPGFRLAPRPGLPGDTELPTGEQTFSSDDYPGLATDIVVGELTIAFPRIEPSY